jgi:hypothetical protein
VNRRRNVENWSVDLATVRPGDFLHVCTEPDEILRVTSNMEVVDALGILKRAYVDLDVLATLKRGLET